MDMDRRHWLIVIAALGVGAIILVAILSNRGDSQAQAQDAFCSSLTSLDSSLQDFQALDASSASQDDYQSAVSAIDDDWDQVKSDAGSLVDVDIDTIEGAWDDFKSAVDDVPDDASVSDAIGDVSGAAKSFASTVQSTLTGPDCSSS